MLSLSVKAGGVMRELDADAPVVWPAWCYAAEGASPAEPSAVGRLGGGGRRRRSGAAPAPAPAPPAHAAPPIKSERLSPPPPSTPTLSAAAPPRDINTPRSDKSRSRSVTPSTASFPGSVSPAGGAMGERGTSPSSVPPPAYPAPPPPVALPLHLTHPPRNYSDFMRSLAAKYNHNNHIDLFQSTRTNGFSPSGLAGATTPAQARPGLSPPSPATLISHPPVASVPPSAASITGLFAGFSRAQPAFPPSLDMTSTKALMAIARAVGVASPVSAGASDRRSSKRPLDGAPLDLSAATAPISKRPRLATPPSSSPAPTSAPPTPCARRCPPTDPAIALWTVDDVCSFVDTIDICAEYSNNFRHQRIDGAGLPLLTEDHLTGMLQMKLGPALKLRASLARRLGACAGCQHCCCKSAAAALKQERPPSNGSSSRGHLSD